jgi:hypothetical protein
LFWLPEPCPSICASLYGPHSPLVELVVQVPDCGGGAAVVGSVLGVGLAAGVVAVPAGVVGVLDVGALLDAEPGFVRVAVGDGLCRAFGRGAP